jgi:carbon-monoxide dehydrogenase medium subunit
MKPAPFDYRRPESLAKAISLADCAEGFVKFLAGGQTLGPMLNLRLVQPDLLIDISRLPELGRVAEEDGHVSIGGGVTHAAIEDGAVPGALGAALARIAGGIAYRSVRNRGSLGGSLAHADPSAEWPSVMLALGAEIVVAGPGGRRTVPVEEFFAGAMTTSLGPAEIVEAVRLPAGARLGFVKLCRKAGEYASALAVVARLPDGRLRAVAGALDGPPRLLPETARALANGTGGAGEGLRADAEAELERLGACADADLRAVHAVVVARAAGEVISE